MRTDVLTCMKMMAGRWNINRENIVSYPLPGTMMSKCWNLETSKGAMEEILKSLLYDWFMKASSEMFAMKARK